MDDLSYWLGLLETCALFVAWSLLIAMVVAGLEAIFGLMLRRTRAERVRSSAPSPGEAPGGP